MSGNINFVDELFAFGESPLHRGGGSDPAELLHLHVHVHVGAEASRLHRAADHLPCVLHSTRVESAAVDLQ